LIEFTLPQPWTCFTCPYVESQWFNGSVSQSFGSVMTLYCRQFAGAASFVVLANDCGHFTYLHVCLWTKVQWF